MPEIKNQPIVNKKEILDKLATAKKALDLITPEVNKAQAAFGGFDEYQSKIQELHNKINKATAVYQTP